MKSCDESCVHLLSFRRTYIFRVRNQNQDNVGKELWSLPFYSSILWPSSEIIQAPKSLADPMLNESSLSELYSSIRILQNIKIRINNLRQHYILNDFRQLGFGPAILHFTTFRSRIPILVRICMANKSAGRRFCSHTVLISHEGFPLIRRNRFAL
jgi:hypothetical protein